MISHILTRPNNAATPQEINKLKKVKNKIITKTTTTSKDDSDDVCGNSDGKKHNI